ncbi:MAG: glycosyltransferase family 2 protein [bacterium]
MASPLFSIIIPTYSRPDLLREAVGSVLAQTVGDFECIVVDDASPLPATVDADRRIRLIHRSRNGGPAAARNTGLSAATGRYVTFLDDDDLYTSDRLAVALEGLTHARLATCWMRHLDAPAGNNRILSDRVSDTILDDLTPHLGAVAVERAVIVPFDEQFIAAEDIDWWLRMAHVSTVYTVTKIGYLMRRHPGPRHGIDAAARVRGRLLLLEMHAAYFATRPRASTFQWKRLGLLARESGDHAFARRAFLRSLSMIPEIDTLWHLVRSFRPSRTRGTNRTSLPLSES